MSAQSDARVPLSVLVAACYMPSVTCRDDPQGRIYSRYSLHPLDEDHVCPGRAVSHFARFPIFFAVEPLFGALG